ncbi:uncharacterized protein E0L32_011195 [Thyridium curvatum]|uniref:Uncharacterized protein n=1 Tax=Thyridium curvatum TaxID=1093900 RepID=A0A507B9W3_9PEZI|nr:uncharacterized protein E0L32_011195 [Thyridium curvatum]TPX19122.1 hypothetical protein E0L32_011195 [Thyridium curvatum]
MPTFANFSTTPPAGLFIKSSLILKNINVLKPVLTSEAIRGGLIIKMSTPTMSNNLLKPKRKCAVLQLIKKSFWKSLFGYSTKNCTKPAKNAECDIAILDELASYNTNTGCGDSAKHHERRRAATLIFKELSNYTVETNFDLKGRIEHRAASQLCKELSFFDFAATIKDRHAALGIYQELGFYNTFSIDDPKDHQVSSTIDNEFPPTDTTDFQYKTEAHDSSPRASPVSPSDSTFSFPARRSSIESTTSGSDFTDQCACEQPSCTVSPVETDTEVIELLSPVSTIGNRSPALFSLIDVEDDDNDSDILPIPLPGASFIADDSGEDDEELTTSAAPAFHTGQTVNALDNRVRVDTDPCRNSWNEESEEGDDEEGDDEEEEDGDECYGWISSADMNKAELHARTCEEFALDNGLEPFLDSHHDSHLFDIRAVHWECRVKCHEYWYGTPFGNVCDWEVLDQLDPFAVASGDCPELRLTTPEGENKWLRDPHYYVGSVSWADLDEEDEYRPSPVLEAPKQANQELEAMIQQLEEVKQEPECESEQEGESEGYYYRPSLCDMNREELRQAAEEDFEIRSYLWRYMDDSWGTHLFDLRLAKMTCLDRRERHEFGQPLGWTCTWTILDSPDPFRKADSTVPEIILTTPEGETKYLADMQYYPGSSSWADFDDEDDF